MNEAGNFWVITGAASGIGAATVEVARQAGAHVLALDINDTVGRQLATLADVDYLNCDVADAEAWSPVTATLAERRQPKRVFLNAGIQIAPPDAPLEDYQFSAMNLTRYRQMMGVNVDGVVFGLRALLPHLSAGDAVVVTASLAGITPYAVDPLYAMSKHAVVGLVRSLAPTLAERGIRINALCPGGIDTAIIPEAQRTAEAVFMPPHCIAEEVLSLMQVDQTGKSWAKVAEDKPAFIVRAPGDRG